MRLTESRTRHTSHVTRHTSHVTRHTSHVTRHTSHVTRHTSHVTRHTSHVTRHTSHVTRHTSHVTRHTSHVTRHTPACHLLRKHFKFFLCRIKHEQEHHRKPIDNKISFRSQQQQKQKPKPNHADKTNGSGSLRRTCSFQQLLLRWKREIRRREREGREEDVEGFGRRTDEEER
jgi:hypothetical protein